MTVYQKFKALPIDHSAIGLEQSDADVTYYCAPKELPANEYDRNGYIAFWNEWHRRYADAKEGAAKT